MSSNIVGSLANAAKALTAHRYGITTAGNNLANVNNENYARQSVVVGEDGVYNSVYGPQGTGVEVQGFEQARDTLLDREVLRETSINSGLEAKQTALEKAESALGQEIDRAADSSFIDGNSDSSSSGGIADALNQFFNSAHSLSADPTSTSEKESFLQQAQILAEKLNVTAERFSDLKSDLTLQAETDVGEANQLLKEIASLNSEIAKAEANKAGQALTLRDQRQELLQDLSELVQVKVEDIEGSNGQVRVYMLDESGANQVDLVSRGHYQQIAYEETATGPEFSISGSGTKLQIMGKGGSIAGALDARDNAIADFEDGLDQLANALVDRVNDIYSATGDDLFHDSTAAHRTAAGISLAITDSSDLKATATTNGGANEIILAIGELGDEKVTDLGGRDIGTYYRKVVTDLAENVSSVQSQLEDETVVFDMLKQQQDSISGVSIDEEMTDMMKFQRAFQATGKVISAIDEMLDVIVNRLI